MSTREIAGVDRRSRLLPERTLMLTAIHVLLTYQCTFECDHCFLHCGPRREGTFTLSQIRLMLREIKRIKTVDTVYFEGGEPFLFYAVLLAALRMVRDLGLQAGIVTNGYWATSLDDARSSGSSPCSV